MRTPTIGRRASLTIFAVCALLYVVILPALPDEKYDDIQWIASLIIAIVGIVWLITGIKARPAAQIHHGQQPAPK